jgi:hypothetical protein
MIDGRNEFGILPGLKKCWIGGNPIGVAIAVV